MINKREYFIVYCQSGKQWTSSTFTLPDAKRYGKVMVKQGATGVTVRKCFDSSYQVVLS